MIRIRLKLFLFISFTIFLFFLGFKWILYHTWKEDNPWSTLTKRDLEASLELIKLHHPAAVDKEESHDAFKAWMYNGFYKSLEKANEVTSYEGYKFALAYYIAGFKDGHFGIKTPGITFFWPGFLLAYKNGKYYIERDPCSSLPSELPPNKAEVVACNDKDPSQLMESNIFPFVVDDPTIDSSWTRMAPWLLIDHGNPWAEKIKTITYCLNGKNYTYYLNWYKTSRVKLDQNIQIASYGYGKTPNFGVREFGENNVWISIPTFNCQKEDEKKALTELVDRLPSLRNKDIIVFDVRGNGGGSSDWVVKILHTLYGEEFLGSIPHIKNETAFADERVSAALIHFLLESYPQDAENNPKQTNYIHNRLENLMFSFAQGDLFKSRGIDVNDFSKMKNGKQNIKNPVKGKVYLLTDGKCFSSCLIFADSILSIPGVVQIGEMTNADTKFIQPLLFNLPGGVTNIAIPSAIRRNWERGNNEPYHPQHKFPSIIGDTADQQKLEEWILNLSQ